MSDRTIEVAQYIAAFRTWANVFSSSGRGGDDDDAPVPDVRPAIETMLGKVRELRGMQQVERLCELCDPALEDAPHVQLAIHKSNLLARMIYGGEALRERRCPVHDGRWSGYGYCAAGCQAHPDPNITGWLPNDFVDDWPARTHDPKLAALEEAIIARFERDELVVYADYLQQLGDPRGYLMASDPMLGFPDVRLLDADGVRTLFERVDGRFVWRVTIECDAWSLGGIVRFLASRRLAWLVQISANHAIAPDDLAKLRASAPKVVVT